MKTKDFIKKIDDNILDWSLENQKSLKDVPTDLDDKIFSMIDEESRIYKAQNPPVKKNKIILFNILKFRYSFAFSCALILIIALFTLFFLKPEIIPFYKKTLLVEVAESKGDIKLEKNNKIITDKKIQKNTLIKSGKKSNAVLKIGSDSLVKINENSIVKILESYKYKKDEHLKIQFDKGNIDCEVLLATNNSYFAVLTETAEFEVKGTKFQMISIDDNIQLLVKKGSVDIKNIFKLDPAININKIKDRKIKKIVGNIKDSSIRINAGQQITLNKKSIKQISKEYNSMIFKKIYNKQNIEKNEIKLIEKELLSFKNRSDGIITKEIIIYDENTSREQNNIEESPEQIEEEKNVIKNMGRYFDGKFSDKDTAIISDNANLIVSSNLNKSVFYINPANGKLLWSFSDKRLKNITSNAVGYKNKIVIPSHEKIFILNKDGTILKIEDIHEGTSFWADPRIVNNKLYIPGYKDIYIYDGNNITVLENLNDINGQIYFNKYNDNIILNCMNDKKIFVYNLPEKKIIWKSDNLNNRSFISPLVIKNMIFTADLSGNIYKFNYKSDSTNAKIIKLASSITSEFIHYNEYIYFIGGDGYLYKLNIHTFNKPVKIVKADNNPKSEKYLVKKMLIHNKNIYFSSDNGKLLIYSLDDKNHKFLDVVSGNNSLVGSPVKHGKFIYLIDDSGYVYQLSNF